MGTDGVWREVTDGVLGGGLHDLSDRVSALGGIAHILAADHPGEPMVELLVAEVGRLEETLGLLRAYPRGASAEPEVLSLTDVVPVLGRLYERRAAEGGVAVEVELEEGLPAVRVSWTAFARAVLVLVWGAGVTASTANSTSERRVRVTGWAEAGDVVVAVSPAVEDAEVLEAAAGMAEEAGGRVEGGALRVRAWDS